MFDLPRDGIKGEGMRKNKMKTYTFIDVGFEQDVQARCLLGAHIKFHIIYPIRDCWNGFLDLFRT